MSLNLKGLFVAVALGAAGVFPWGAYASDFQSPRTAALGGAGHAGPLLNDAIYLNPAFASLLPTYSVAGSYFGYSGTGTDNTPPHGHGLNLSVQDGRSEMFQAGVGYTVRNDATMLHVGASKAVAQRTGIGVGGKLIFPSTGDRKAISDTTISAVMVPYDFLQASVIVDNLIQSDRAKANGFFREYILGTKTNLQGICLVYFDPHLVPDDPVNSSFGYEAGLEFPVMQDVYLRTGMFKNATVAMAGLREHGYSLGLGWIAPRLSLDYAFTRAIDPQSFVGHTLGFTVYF
jgi:hypothetical protein